MGTRRRKKIWSIARMFGVCQVFILAICPQLTSLIAEFMHNIGVADAGVAQKWKSSAANLFWIRKLDNIDHKVSPKSTDAAHLYSLYS